MRREIFFAAAFAFAALLTGCEAITFVEEEATGTLSLSMNYADMPTKAVIRPVPDTNDFILFVKGGMGNTVYKGKYGARPKEMVVPVGSYEVWAYSSEFTAPAYDLPVYEDRKNLLVQSGMVNSLSLVCRQSNSGLRLLFTNNFKQRFKDVELKVADSRGAIPYQYTESRFLYLSPGSIRLFLAPSGAITPATEVLSRDILPNEMVTLKLDAQYDSPSTGSTGISVDTVSIWSYNEYMYGSQPSGDGSSKSSAIDAADVASHVGEKGVWISGFIVGGDLTQSAIKFDAPFTSESNMAIASLANERDRAKCVAVSIPTGAIRDVLSLKVNPGNIGKRVYIKGNIVAEYFKLPGVNTLSEAEF